MIAGLVENVVTICNRNAKNNFEVHGFVVIY